MPKTTINCQRICIQRNQVDLPTKENSNRNLKCRKICKFHNKEQQRRYRQTNKQKDNKRTIGIFAETEGYRCRDPKTGKLIPQYLSIATYPEVIIAIITDIYAGDATNKVRTNTNLNIREVDDTITQYELKSVVSQDTKTGRVYEEKEMFDFKEYTPEIMRRANN